MWAVISVTAHLVSMSAQGNYCDNAAVETLFKALKAELIWRHTWAIRALFRFSNGFYNTRRRHSAVRGAIPAMFERKIA